VDGAVLRPSGFSGTAEETLNLTVVSYQRLEVSPFVSTVDAVERQAAEGFGRQTLADLRPENVSVGVANDAGTQL